jgi:hypothetical protein
MEKLRFLHRLECASITSRMLSTQSQHNASALQRTCHPMQINMKVDIVDLSASKMIIYIASNVSVMIVFVRPGK